MDEHYHVWNRAAFDSAGERALRGDRALAHLLLFHGYVMNGGLSHGFELSADEVAGAIEGFRFFGFNELADFLDGAADKPDEQENLSEVYARFVDDGTLAAKFEMHYRAFPDDFAPVTDA